jgi:hypothetical protein
MASNPPGKAAFFKKRFFQFIHLSSEKIGMKENLLAQLENSVRDGRYLEAGNALFPILREIEQGAKTISGVAVDVEATRLAAAITRILVDTNVSFPRPLFLEMNRFKRCIVQIFEVSGYRGTWHLLQMLGKTDASGVCFYEGQELLRLFTGLSINSMTLELADALLRMDPRWSFVIALGFLSEQVLFTPQAELVRSKLLESGHLWENIDTDAFLLRPDGPPIFPLSLPTAYMGCSYADAPHKHEIKKCMNKIVRRWLEKNGVRDTAIPAELTLKKRPKLVVFAEVYDPFHAMHRCFGPSIESLKEHFDTTMVIANTRPHPELNKLAHKVETLDLPKDNPIDLIAKLQALEPDILYLPSIGMRFSSIAVSNVRIAPVQVMTFGHPATTHSELIDYVILGKGFTADHTVSEKAILRRRFAVFTHRTDAEQILPSINLDPEIVRIAVPAWSRKVTPRFLQTCQRIRNLAKKKVEFWFFPNASGYLYQAVRTRYEGMLPGSVVQPTKSFNDYIRDLNQCDIFLSTFPFGSTNGVIDAALQGLPIVNMTGDEVHSSIDGALARMLNQPEWLTTKSIEEYVQAAVRLIDDSELRVHISRNILEKNPASEFFTEKVDSDNFAIIFKNMYLQHEYIKCSENKIFPYEKFSTDLTALK